MTITASPAQRSRPGCWGRGCIRPSVQHRGESRRTHLRPAIELVYLALLALLLSPISHAKKRLVLSTHVCYYWCCYFVPPEIWDLESPIRGKLRFQEVVASCEGVVHLPKLVRIEPPHRLNVAQ